MNLDEKNLKAHCRSCGGSRWHIVLYREKRRWSDDDTPVYSGDDYEVLQCAGCETIGFRHRHWFSEDHDGQGEMIVHQDYYPPAPIRAIPDWESELVFSLKIDDWWLAFLLKDVYAATGLRSYSLAAMGARAIVDSIVTSEAGDGGRFCVRKAHLVEYQIDIPYDSQVGTFSFRIFAE